MAHTTVSGARTALTRNPHRVLAGRLGGNERAVRSGYQFIVYASPSSIPTPTLTVIGKGSFAECRSTWRLILFGDVQGHLRRRARHDDDELLATKSGTDVENPDASSQQVGHVTECTVPFKMTPGVIDPLEVIDVDHQQGEVLPLPARPLNLLLKAILEVATIEEPCDGVDCRNPRELNDVLGQSLPGESQGGSRRQHPRSSEVASVEVTPVVPVGQGDDSQPARAGSDR